MVCSDEYDRLILVPAVKIKTQVNCEANGLYRAIIKSEMNQMCPKVPLPEAILE